MNRTVKITLEHVTWEEPVTKTMTLKGDSLSAIVKQLKINGRQACELKSTLYTSWEDARGVFHHMSIEEQT